MKKALLISIFISLTTSLIGQHVGTRFYTVSDGLPLSTIADITEDSLGYLWIATSGGGLSKFDGISFENFNEEQGLINNATMNLYNDSNGQLWITTARGISKTSINGFKNYPVTNGPLTYFKVFEWLGQMYAFLPALKGNPARYARVQNDSLIVETELDLPFKNAMKDFIIMAPNKILFITKEEQLIFLDNESSTILNNSFERITEYMFLNNRIYLDTNQGIIRVGDKGELNRISESQFDSLFSVATQWRLPTIHPTGHLIYRWLKSLDLNSFQAKTAMMDREGNVWIGTANHGLIKVFRKSFLKLNKKKNVKAKSLLIDQFNNTWVGTEGDGIEVFNDTTQINRWIFADEEKNIVNSIQQDSQGTIWIGTNGGLATYIPSSKKIVWRKETEFQDKINKIAIDPMDNVWCMVGNKGIYRINPFEIRRFNEIDGLFSTWGWDMKYLPLMNKLVVCTEIGINFFSENRFDKLNAPMLNRKLLITLAEIDSSHLIVGTGGSGIYVIDLINQDNSVNLTDMDGLSSNFIFSASVDQYGILWLGSATGIDAVKLNKLFKIEYIHHFAKESGLEGVETNLNAVAIGEKKMVFGLVDGVYQFVEGFDQTILEYPLHISSVKLFFDEPINPFNNRISLDRNQNHLTFSYNKLSKSYSENIRFKYKLENWDADWSPPTNEKKVSYTHLLPGKYQFRLASTNSQGIWTPNYVSIEVFIDSAFYEKIWFRSLLVCLMVVVIYSVFALLNRLKLKEERIRNEEKIKIRADIARDFHDEMGNQLARIINYVGLLKLNKSNWNELLNKTEETSKYLLSGTKDFLWAIDPINDNMDSLTVQIRDFGEKLLSEQGIEFRVYSSIRHHISLPFGFTRQINLIIKEGLTNVFKHANATAVELHFDVKGKVIAIILLDNGHGFNIKETLTQINGRGLENMKSRAIKIFGDLKITTNEPTGTRIELTFTLP
jgi:signal transduction histidine kinase/ligand-binding sensor domain-containing protein